MIARTKKAKTYYITIPKLRELAENYKNGEPATLDMFCFLDWLEVEVKKICDEQEKEMNK